MNEDWKNKPIKESGGLTQNQLEEAFNLVSDKKDWKAPINATIDATDEQKVYHAVIHFTGTVPDFYVRPNGKLLVVADGYRNGPCGP